ncbi:MAG TPA: EAL domain-containing protein [Myxococcota bacterium]|nr:EAL domain-containing protein [Myxococcota bacterium]
MTLVRKAALLVALFTVANIGFGYAIKRNLIDRAIEGFEQRSADKSMSQVAEALEREYFHLDTLAREYGQWDATYDFMETHDPQYHEDNLSLDALAESNIDWSIAVDTAGNVVSGPIYDIKTRKLVAVPEVPQTRWPLTHPLLAGDTRVKRVAGVMVTQAGPMIVAARDILTNRGEGPSRGRIVMARALDAAFVTDLGKRVGLDLRFWLAGDAAMPEGVTAALARAGGDAVVTWVDPRSEQLGAYRQFRDITGEPAIIFGAPLSRELAHSAAFVGLLCAVWIVLQGAILAFIILVPLHRAIIAPLGVLSRQLSRFRKSSDLKLSLDTEQRGEIAEISREFGTMLRQLEAEIRERRRGEEALRQSEQHLRAAQKVAQIGSWRLELADGSWWWSDELFRIAGRAVDAGPPSYEQVMQNIDAGDRERVALAFRELIRGANASEGIEFRARSTAGELRQYSILWHVERDASGNAYRAFGTASDVTERRRAEEQLRRAAAVFDTATESIVIANPAGIIVDANAAFSATTGYRHDEVIGQSVNILSAEQHGTRFFGSILEEVRQSGRWEGELWVRHKQGRAIPAWISIGCAVGDRADIEQIVVVFNDMTERKKSEEVIAHQANYDMLTKLPNRYLLRDRLRRALVRAKRDGSSVGLLFIDLDGFKRINDTLGHSAGDEALAEAARRINRSLRDADTAARLGGDEFAVILPSIANDTDIEGVAQRILDAIAAPLVVHGQELVLTASIGIAIYPADSETDEDLLRDADAAMYRSKLSGGNALEFFTEEMNASAARRLQVELQLRKALELGEFQLHFQPIVALPDARMVGVEALLRWESAVLGAVSPGEFIPLAERSGLIAEIGAWVLEAACRQVKAWHDAGWPALRVAVNLSPREVERGDVVSAIRSALAQSGLPAQQLEIEVTERVLLDDVERVSAIFREIKQLGVRLCIDDFGTGYSSLSYLQHYSFDVLKIDRAFVHGAIGHEDGVSLLRAINSMAESLHLEVVAEGVETREQLDLLCGIGCGFAQGYYFCRPMSPEQLELGDHLAQLRDSTRSSA